MRLHIIGQETTNDRFAEFGGADYDVLQPEDTGSPYRLAWRVYGSMDMRILGVAMNRDEALALYEALGKKLFPGSAKSATSRGPR